ncbi:hypothetical protein [Paenibacillus solani]|uniref:Uncharacterized protein n=1 Tax=Paenibacillus solani TaxID=1705565 RepID=A0A0M1P266_9BACL|nr:hypothetical protein [Paenibacillus solani]KOR88593.1 hypothetical protein AM231_05120 [Paenibacillus solani]
MKPSIPPPPTQEDEALIKDYLLHRMLQTVLERDIQIFKTLELTMTNLYILNLQHIIKRMSDPYWTVKHQIRQRGIRIESKSWTPEGEIQVLYLCRGYQRSLLCSWPPMKEELKDRIISYLGTDLAAY